LFVSEWWVQNTTQGIIAAWTMYFGDLPNKHQRVLVAEEDTCRVKIFQR
jgi:hypothetical protein